MELEEAIKVMDASIKSECEAMKWTVTEDLLQDGRFRVWILGMDPKRLTTTLIRRVAKCTIIKDIRAELRRCGKPMQKTPLTKKEWESIIDERTEETDLGGTLDAIESKLSDEQRVIFRHLRRGHPVYMIARAMGYSKTTMQRMAASVMEIAKEIGQSIG